MASSPTSCLRFPPAPTTEMTCDHQKKMPSVFSPYLHALEISILISPLCLPLTSFIRPSKPRLDVTSSRKPCVPERQLLPPLAVTVPSHHHYCLFIELTPLPDSELPRSWNGAYLSQISQHLAQPSTERPQGNAFEMNEPTSNSTTLT